MKASHSNLENIVEKITKARIPVWAKTTVLISVAVTPLLQSIFLLVIVNQIINLVIKLLTP